jgi:hypothetical protein
LEWVLSSIMEGYNSIWACKAVLCDSHVAGRITNRTESIFKKCKFGKIWTPAVRHHWHFKLEATIAQHPNFKAQEARFTRLNNNQLRKSDSCMMKRKKEQMAKSKVKRSQRFKCQSQSQWSKKVKWNTF